MNILAWCIGMIASVPLIYVRRAFIYRCILWTAPFALILTLFGTGQDGVHRWLVVGPIRANAAALLLPIAVVILAHLSLRRPSEKGAAALILAILVMQPDASQATSFAAAMAYVMLRSSMPKRQQLITLAILLLTTIVVWLRPDSLLPVQDVEGALHLLWAASPGVAVIAALILALTCMTPLFDFQRPALRQAGRAPGALALYFCLTALMPFVGHYPVPLIGLSASPIIGFWLGMGMLFAVRTNAPVRGP